MAVTRLNTANSAIDNASSLSDHKYISLMKLKAHFQSISQRPRVDTGLGFDVDGSHNDLQNYQIGKDLGLLVVKDADNNNQTITLPDYDTILLAIKIHGLTLLQTKWTHQANIEALTTMAEIEAYDITTGW